MWPFNRKNKSSNPVTPTAVKEYYQATSSSEKMWLVWVVSIGTFIITVIIVLGLFWAGRWVIRQFTDDNPKTVAPTTQESADDKSSGDKSSQDEQKQQSQSANNGGSSAGSSNSSSNSSGSQAGGSTGTSSTSTTAPATTPNTGPSGNLPNTGPDSDE